MPASDVPPTTPPASATPKRRRSIVGWFLRLLFKGKRALVTVPMLLFGVYVGWESLVYWWYRGVSDGERTGIITKVSRKGNPLCRYWSVEMRVGQQAGAALLNSEIWEFTVDSAYDWLIPDLEQAARQQKPVTIKYRQDSTDVQAKPTPPPINLPWRYCVDTSYHATGVIGGK